MQLLRLYIKKPTANSTFAIGGVSCSADSFVVAESSVLRMNICAENPAHRKSANRSVLMYEIGEKIIERGYRYAESNFEYESNFAVRSLWRHFSHRQHKCRRCYQKYFLSSTRSEDSI